MAEHRATFRFYAELAAFLSNNADSGQVVRPFNGSPSVKDQIEACGIPHTEVDLILVNGESVDFDCRLSDGDLISVYPVFESFDIASISRVRPEPLRKVRFVVDVNLGKLARYLRLLGFDSVADGDLDDADLVEVSVEQHRILLTKDRGLLKRAAVTHGYFVRSIQPDDQVIEVVHRFDLSAGLDPFRRCMECNGKIESVSGAEVEHLLEPLTKLYFDEFRRCSECLRVYWRGSHVTRLESIVETARGGASHFRSGSTPQ